MIYIRYLFVVSISLRIATRLEDYGNNILIITGALQHVALERHVDSHCREIRPVGSELDVWGVIQIGNCGKEERDCR